MNKVILVGRLTRNPEVRYTQKGTAVASFSIAVNTGFGDNKRADFVPIVVWDKLAEICGNNLIKGSKVLVEGRLQISDYEKDGQKRRITEVVGQNVEFLEPKQAQASHPPKDSVDHAGNMGVEVYPENEDEIPF